MTICFRHVWLIPVLGLLGGCATNTPSEPRTRLGSIPFPGVFTLYATADPSHLGQHRYEAWWEKLDGPGETSRGILYSCRAGFLDLSHIRDTADWCKYIHDRSLEVLGNMGQGGASSHAFAFNCSDARYEVELRAPECWHALSQSERDDLTREAAIRIGQRMSVILSTWHEIGTWYGQETIPGISERNSAFTWDDGTSHVVASIIAGRALRSRDPWDVAVTRELDAELASLGIVDPACQSRAIDMVKDRWWKDGTAARRDLDTGLEGQPKVPWLVQGLDCCSNSQYAELTVVDLRSVHGRDLSDLLHFRIIPSKSILRKALACSSDCPSAIQSESDLFTALVNVRQDLKAVLGPHADEP
ncbi:MAG: DUF4056 domain-containing protein [Phycisphaerales bacterium]